MTSRRLLSESPVTLAHSEAASIPGYIKARLRLAMPSGHFVVPRSTPVIAFGDFPRATVATLGLNPSRLEFLSKRGDLLAGPNQRFQTMTSLGLNDLQAASDQALLKIVEACRLYFMPGHNPYMDWFGDLENLLRVIGASYLDGSACHLDLVQWSTDPTWRQLPEATRRHLLTLDVPFLIEQLKSHRIGLLLLNGQRVITELTASTGCRVRLVDQIPWGTTMAGITVGAFDGIQLIGWSPNLQSSFGVTNVLRAAIADRVASLASRA